MVHDVAAGGFADADDYEAARPSYPDEAIVWFAERLVMQPRALVADIAAGTGKLTRLLAALPVDVVAVEPVAGMRAQFRRFVPDVPMVAGTAESLPFRDEALDAATVAQAWHWFDAARAAAELRRALRPDGRIGLVWNARDRTVPWVDAVWSIMDRVERRAPWRNRDWSGPHSLDGFRLLHRSEFRHEQVMTPHEVIRRVASVSHVAVLPAGEREAVLDEVGDVLADLGPVDHVTMPYRTDCFVYARA
jgi:SAM-dependent methyltransferase